MLFGDGSPLGSDDLKALDALHDYMRANQVAFEWEAGDALILDNNSVLHSRQSFTPPRRVLASLCGPPADAKRGVASANSAEKAPNVPSLALPSRDRIPVLGVGLWKVPCGERPNDVGYSTLYREARFPARQVPRGECAQLVVDAIKAGYRHLDCAADYANEAEVGAGIAAAISEGLVRRESPTGVRQ